MQSSGVIFREVFSVRGVQRGCHDISVKESKRWFRILWDCLCLQRRLQNLDLCSNEQKYNKFIKYSYVMWPLGGRKSKNLYSP